jgi:hypothetical protein
MALEDVFHYVSPVSFFRGEPDLLQWKVLGTDRRE